MKTWLLERSDNLVVEAAGGEAMVKQILDMDKAGFRESEVMFMILLLAALLD